MCASPIPYPIRSFILPRMYCKQVALLSSLLHLQRCRWHRQNIIYFFYLAIIPLHTKTMSVSGTLPAPQTPSHRHVVKSRCYFYRARERRNKNDFCSLPTNTNVVDCSLSHTHARTHPISVLTKNICLMVLFHHILKAHHNEEKILSSP